MIRPDVTPAEIGTEPLEGREGLPPLPEVEALTAELVEAGVVLAPRDPRLEEVADPTVVIP